MRIVRWLLSGLLLTTSLLWLGAGAPPATAETTTACPSLGASYYSATYKAPEGTYDVFVKLGKRGQSAPVRLQTSDKQGKCRVTGELTANGDTWQKIGVWTNQPETQTLFSLDTPTITGGVDANRPALLLLPQNTPPCVPTTICEYTVEGQEGFIEPISTLLNEQDLRILRVVDPKQDTLTRVDYYASGQFLYSTDMLEPFDMRYVPGGQQTLSRVLRYESGQSVVLQNETYVSFVTDFRNLLFRLVTNNRVGLQIAGILFLISVAIIIALAVIHLLHRRYVWKLSHGFIATPTARPGSPTGDVPPAHFLSPEAPLVTIAKRGVPIVLIVIGIITLFSLLDVYVIQFFRVNGPSMENTLQTDDRLFINKGPVTWASLNNGEYVPQRGEMIVFREARSDLIEGLSEEHDGDTFIVKRVLGLPGERVVVKDGVVTVYNHQHPEGFNPDTDSTWSKTMIPGTGENLDITLSPREVFVSGDNRRESLDSRTNGPVRLENIVGKVEARLFPFSERRIF